MNIEKIDVNIEPNMEQVLMQKLQCDPAGLSEKLKGIATAASEELIRMMLGEKNFTRGADIREYRLFLLIQHYFKCIPDENIISTLFQTTPAESRSLLRSTIAKYSFQLQDFIKSSIVKILNQDIIVDSDGKNLIKNVPLTLIDEMNSIVSSIDGSHSQIKKKRDTLQVFEIPEATLSVLKEELGINE